MNIQVPADMTATVQSLIAGGNYKDEDAVLREALAILKKREDDIAAIKEGLADVEAGRIRPWSDTKAEIQSEFGFTGK